MVARQQMISWGAAFLVAVIVFGAVRSALAQFMEEGVLSPVSEPMQVGSDAPDGPGTFRQIFVVENGSKRYLTATNYTNADPVSDGEYVAWMGQVYGGWQIFLHRRSTSTTVQLTQTGNNVNPRISQGNVVWEGQVDGVWQVFLFDGVSVRQVTEGDVSVHVEIEGDAIVFNRRAADGEWRAVKYVIGSQQSEVILRGPESKRPRVQGGRVVLPIVAEREAREAAERERVLREEEERRLAEAEATRLAEEAKRVAEEEAALRKAKELAAEQLGKQKMVCEENEDGIEICKFVEGVGIFPRSKAPVVEEGPVEEPVAKEEPAAIATDEGAVAGEKVAAEEPALETTEGSTQQEETTPIEPASGSSTGEGTDVPPSTEEPIVEGEPEQVTEEAVTEELSGEPLVTEEVAAPIAADAALSEEPTVPPEADVTPVSEPITEPTPEPVLEPPAETVPAPAPAPEPAPEPEPAPPQLPPEPAPAPEG